MLSRIAENLYWIGRHIERIGNTVNLLEVTNRAVIENTKRENDTSRLWSSLLTANQEEDSFEKTGQPVNETTVHDFLLLSLENPSSIHSSLWNVRENIRSARNRLSPTVWLIVNEFYLEIKSMTVERVLNLDRDVFFRKIRQFCLAFSGACDHTLLHDEAWHFLRLGRALERAIQTAQLLDFHESTLRESLDHPENSADIRQWQILLRSVDGLEAYIQAYQSRIVPKNVVELLLKDTRFPRSILFNVGEIEDIFRKIPHLSGSVGYWLLNQNVSSLQAEIRSHRIEDVFQTGQTGPHGFDDYLQNILSCLLRLNGLFYQSCFGDFEGESEDAEPAAPTSSTQGQIQ